MKSEGKYKKIPSTVSATFVRILHVLIFVGVQSALAKFFSSKFLLTEEFAVLPLYMKHWY